MQKIINIYNTINLDCKKSFFIILIYLSKSLAIEIII